MKIALINIFLSTLLFISCNPNSDSAEINLVNKDQLTQDEIDDLLFLREEEKLARDVYIYSYNKYNLQVFKNISDSESQHMSSVLTLLNKYNLNDPASNIVGEFNNPTLQEIYDNLIENSNVSLLEALKVGDKIEDLDIRDLGINEERTEKVDLLSLYVSLKCGSKNHLRSFNSQVMLYDGFYTPEFISQETFDSIISTPIEKCGTY